MKILIIGGTRNLGYYITQQLLADEHRITLLNRGITPDPFPDHIARLRCDRGDIQQMRRALAGREFDVVIDTVVYTGAEAEDILEVLKGQVGHYIFISTGQVYLVRQDVQRPIREDQYEGPLIPRPDEMSYDYEEWLYGMEKRAAEDRFAEAYRAYGFPFTSLRLPMVNSQRDGFHRLYGYMLRIKDGGPVLIPDKPNYPLRHVYAGDVVQAVKRLVESGMGKGKAYNISQDETLPLVEFLEILAEVMGMKAETMTIERDLLEANGLLPDCSPFSDLWMSELDNTLSKTELGMSYTPLREYLQVVVAHYMQHPPAKPVGYKRRRSEKNLLMSI